MKQVLDTIKDSSPEETNTSDLERFRDLESKMNQIKAKINLAVIKTEELIAHLKAYRGITAPDHDPLGIERELQKRLSNTLGDGIRAIELRRNDQGTLKIKLVLKGGENDLESIKTQFGIEKISTENLRQDQKRPGEITSQVVTMRGISSDTLLKILEG